MSSENHSPTDPDTPDPSISAVAHEEGPIARRVEVRVAAERVRAAFDDAYRDLARRAQLKGFRKGRAPRTVLERLYGASVAEEIGRTLVRETLGQAIEQTRLEPVSPPAIDPEPARPDADFTYTARVEVRPAIELPELEGLPASQPVVSVSDEDVASELERLREHHAPVIEEPEDTVVTRGHIVSVDFVGRVGGQAFEGGTGRDVEIEIGAGRFVPGFEEGLEGARAGEDREVRVAFPDDYGNPQLAGKEAVFQVHVAEVKRRQLADLDDEFAKDLGEFDTLEELRGRIRSDLLAARQRGAQAALHRSLLDALVERTDFDVPPGLVEQQLEHRLETAARQLHGSLEEDALHAELDRLRVQWREPAEREVREQLLIEAVAERAGVEVEESEIEIRVARMAEERGLHPDRLRQALGEGVAERLAGRQLRDEKALDFLSAAAKVEDSTAT